MKVSQLFEDTFSYEFDNKDDGLRDLLKMSFRSSIEVRASYSDYPSIDKDADRWFKTFFKQFGAKRKDIGHYTFSLDSMADVKRLILTADEYFNDEDAGGEPGLQWPFSFAITAQD